MNICLRPTGDWVSAKEKVEEDRGKYLNTPKWFTTERIPIGLLSIKEEAKHLRNEYLTHKICN